MAAVDLYPNGSSSAVRTPTVSAYDGFGGYHSYTADGLNYDVYNPVGFGGQYGYYHDYQGYYLLGHRYYDPRAGRFVTRDPIGYKGGMNLYSLAGYNPVNQSDPSGDIPSGRYHPTIGPSNPFLQRLSAGLQQVGDFLNQHFGPSVDVHPVGQYQSCGCAAGAYGDLFDQQAHNLQNSQARQTMSMSGTRTGHALEGEAAGRPVKQALGDAQKAREADVFLQDGKYVVRGANSREHILSSTVRKVITAMTHRPNAAHLNRLRNNIIRPVTEEEYEAFQKLYK